MKSKTIAILSAFAGAAGYHFLNKKHLPSLPNTATPLCDVFYRSMNLKLSAANKNLPMSIRKQMLSEAMLLDEAREKANCGWL